MQSLEITLRPYQIKAIDEIKEALAAYKRVILQSPTGSGKGLLISELAYKTSLKGNICLIVSHRIEVVNQNMKHVMNKGTNASVISASGRKIPTTNVAVAMAQTLQRRKDKDEWMDYLKSIKLLILDEAHTSEMNFLFQIISPNCFVVGFTATPVRYGNQRQLGLDYNAIVTTVQVRELIDMGFLCKCRLFGLDAPDLSDVDFDYSRGDYSLGQMAKKFQSKVKYIGIVDNWENICKGTKTIIFCSSSEQTIEITKEFISRGYRAKYVLSGSFDEDDEYSGQRKIVMDEFSKGDFDILVNLGIGTTGLDVPSIKTVILGFSTVSLTKYLQCLGRGSRMHPSKNGEFICLDFGGNFDKLGLYGQDRVWHLWHNKNPSGPPLVKECPIDKKGCGRLIHISYTDCPFCGYHFPTSQEIYKIELQEIVIERTEEETIGQYVARKKLDGWGNDWILRDICHKNGENPKEAFMGAIKILNTCHGSKIKPSYWYFFKVHKLSKKG
ncbi:MAG: DEAD/DEAH box helicase [Bacteroidaceae bacterium]